MRKKVNFSLLKEITLNELDTIAEDEILLSVLVEQVAVKYSTSNHMYVPMKSTNYRKAKACDTTISQIAQNNGWATKRRIVNYDYLIDDKIIMRQTTPIILYRLQEEE